MRALHAAVLVSVVAHVASLAIIAVLRDASRTPAASSDPPAPRIDLITQPADRAPIDVVILDAPSTRATERELSRASPLDQRRAAISTRRGATASGSAETTAPPEPGKPRGTSLMTMRRPEKPGMRGLSSKFVDDFLARSKPLEPIPDIPGARIDTEIADIQASLRNPNLADRTGYRFALAALRAERAKLELKTEGGGRWKAEKETFKAAVDPDGKVHLTDKPNVTAIITPIGISGKFDATDALMRGAGIDPYAREKLKLLDRTRDQRAAIGSAHKSQQLAKSTQIMQRNLEYLWAHVLDTPARKAGLFELWDECTETGDRELVAGGSAARKLVIGFIRARLTGADAYTAAELARLNRTRQSKAVFAPYGDAPDASGAVTPADTAPPVGE